MHQAARKFMIECQEQAQEFPMQAEDEEKKVQLSIQKGKESFGLIHGDFNINAIKMSSRTQMSIQNFENARHGFYLEDLGNFIFDISFRIEELALLSGAKEMPPKEQDFVDWICDGYSAQAKVRVDRDHLRVACVRSRDAFK